MWRAGNSFFVMDASARHLVISVEIFFQQMSYDIQKNSLQVLHLQYGMYVWPCAVVLAQYLWFHRRCLPGKAILEVQEPLRFQKHPVFRFKSTGLLWVLSIFKLGVGVIWPACKAWVENAFYIWKCCLKKKRIWPTETKIFTVWLFSFLILYSKWSQLTHFYGFLAWKQSLRPSF